MIGIYKIENLINGKIYVGQSTDIEKRWKEHKQIPYRDSKAAEYARHFPLYRAILKYGLENFKFSVIEECTIEELDQKERYWISYYNTFTKEGQNGYNLTSGGDGSRRLYKETIDTIKTLWQQGYTTGEIGKIINKDKHIIISYLKNYEPTYNIQESNLRAVKQSGIKHRKGIVQYDYCGRYIKYYNSITEANQETKIPVKAIRDSANGRRKGAQTFYFIFADDNQEEKLELLMNMYLKTFNPVIQLDVNNNYVACYVSKKEASEKTGISIYHINSSLKGLNIKTDNYKWKDLKYSDIKKYNIK